MSKELEALEFTFKQLQIANEEILEDDSIFDGGLTEPQIERYNKLKQALTPPTAEQVCKALSEYYNVDVVFKNKVFQWDVARAYVYMGMFNAYKKTINLLISAS